MYAPELLQHRRQIFNGYMIRTRPLCRDKLYHSKRIRGENVTNIRILKTAVSSYFCFQGLELQLSELALQPRIGDKNTEEARHCLPIRRILPQTKFFLLAHERMSSSSQNRMSNQFHDLTAITTASIPSQCL
jgi:hypothetical protein